MTPSERERRIEVAREAIYAEMTRKGQPRATYSDLARVVLDAADEAVPMVSEDVRDFAKALRYLADRESWLGDPLDQRSTLHGHFTPYELARDVLARSPSFSGEEGDREMTVQGLPTRPVERYVTQRELAELMGVKR